MNAIRVQIKRITAVLGLAVLLTVLLATSTSMFASPAEQVDPTPTPPIQPTPLPGEFALGKMVDVYVNEPPWAPSELWVTCRDNRVVLYLVAEFSTGHTGATGPRHCHGGVGLPTGWVSGALYITYTLTISRYPEYISLGGIYRFEPPVYSERVYLPLVLK